MADIKKHELDNEESRRREVKEVATKLRSMSAVEKAEVINRVAARQVTKQLGGFTDFIREQGVVGVGIGLVLGIQMKAVVDTVMSDLVNPVTQLILPGQKKLSAQEAVVQFGGDKVTIGWGAVVYSIITFIIVAFIIYVTYKLLRLDKFKKKDALADDKTSKKKKK
ncbi:MAG TPA: MscL family protein [Candidatus Saccharimonadales bacterium]|nr:MscL family protein [Candidatus Saccharimonadales bacterium]